MPELPEKWESDYDGNLQRWFFRYKPTGMVQYHFPQPGDEYAEFLFDVGTGPIKLTPEDSLAIEQETKRRSLTGFENDTKNGHKTSGSKREKKKIEAIEEDYRMSATGYFDSSMYFPGAYNNISPLDDDEAGDTTSDEKATPETTPSITNRETIPNGLGSHDGVAGNDGRQISPLASNAEPVGVELPGSSQQPWSPVGVVAELATQETVKCAEELAPVELDATSYAPAPIQTNIAQEPAELPTHRTPREDKKVVLGPTQPSMQPVDSYPLVSASFAYPPLKTNLNSTHCAPSGPLSAGEKPASSGITPADPSQNKFQPWKPTQSVIEQQSPVQNKPLEVLSQTSILQNQESDLGSFGWNNSKNSESSKLDDIPNTLAPSLEPRKQTALETPSNTCSETSHIPASLQPAHRPGQQPSSFGNANQQVIPGSETRHDSGSVPVGSHGPAHIIPSALQPGGIHSNNSLQESEGKHTQGRMHHPSEHVTQASSTSSNQPGVTRVNTAPDRLPPANPKMSGSPGFLFFHEIPSQASASSQGPTVYAESTPTQVVKPQTSNSSRIDSQSRISGGEHAPVVAPLNFVKRNSLKNPEVLSVTPEASSNNPGPVCSDDISEVISVISSFTIQESHAPSSQPSQHPINATLGDHSKPRPTLMAEGVGASTDVTPTTQANMTTLPTNIGIIATQSTPSTQATHHYSPPIQGPSIQNQSPSPLGPSQPGNPGKASISSGPLKPQGNISTPTPPQVSATNTSFRPPSQANYTKPTNPAQLGAQNSPNAIHHINNPVQQTQVSTSTSVLTGPTQIPVATFAQQTSHHPSGQSHALPRPTTGSPTAGHSQSAIQKPYMQHPVTSGLSSQQPTFPSLVGHQVASPNTAQTSSRPPYQHSSPATQPVSPLQSQVSSPAQSIASLHVSQSSTPSSTCATLTTLNGTTSGPNTSANQTNIAPVRPSSVPAHAINQQVGTVSPPSNLHPKPSSPAGTVQAPLPSAPNPPAKPYPMLPGQVTPLPSQIGAAPVPPPLQQSVPNNHAKPPANTQQPVVGQQLMQTTTGSSIQQVAPGQLNSIL